MRAALAPHLVDRVNHGLVLGDGIFPFGIPKVGLGWPGTLLDGGGGGAAIGAGAIEAGAVAAALCLT